MLWIAGTKAKKNSKYHKEVVLTACKCARTALKYLPKDEKRPLKAIQTAERWAKGKATIEEVIEARRDAYAADHAAARIKSLKSLANIVRKNLKCPTL